MRHILVFLLVILAGSISLPAQTALPTTTPSQPQSARQALIEMFLGKGADDFTRHLPDAARHALIRKGETPESSVALRISTIGRQLVAQGEKIESFDVGPNILVSEQNNGHERIEVAVERDSLMGEDDEIELSVHVYKDGQLQSLPVVPRLIFTMSQEQESWRLTEVTLAAHMPLTDPDYLKALGKQQDEANESAVQMRVRMIASAEAGYAATHPDRGYTCTLSTLFQRDSTDTATAGGGGFTDPGQANEESNGYRYVLAGCEGNPASTYRLTAAPIEPDSESKTFWADESGTIKFVIGGKGSTCLRQGQAIEAIGPTRPD